MSIYDFRDRPAYGTSRPNPHYCENPLILKWWSALHDALLSQAIGKEQWAWSRHITDKIIAVTPSEIIEEWKAKDPLCSTYAWYNILMNFAESRADKLALLTAIRTPVWRTCPLCEHKFVENSLPAPLVARLGIDQLDFCAPCLSATLFSAGSHTSSKEEVCAYLRRLSDALQRVPPQDFGAGMYDLQGMDTTERLSVLRVLKDKPAEQHVKELFSSWFHALLEAGLLDDGARRTTRGIQCLAKDGHICFSLGEKTIDDLLHASRISHEREPQYPDGNFRADFLVNGVFIEYFGLAGDPDYDLKTKRKQELCKKHRINLISVYPKDLASSKQLEKIIVTGLMEARPTRR
jgi:hypothetical protein